MDPNGSPFRRPPPRPAFRPRRSGFGPVPAASLTADTRTARAARGRSRGVVRDARARALRLGAGAFYVVAALTLLDAALSFASHDPGVIIGLGLTRWAGGRHPGRLDGRCRSSWDSCSWASSPSGGGSGPSRSARRCTRSTG